MIGTAMHEMPIVARILAIAVQAAPPGSRVLRVALSVGALCDADGAWLERYFRVAARGTSCAGAALSVTRELARYRCSACGASFGPAAESGAAPAGLAEVREFVLRGAACPACGSRDCSVDGGSECLVESIEVEEPR